MTKKEINQKLKDTSIECVSYAEGDGNYKIILVMDKDKYIAKCCNITIFDNTISMIEGEYNSYFTYVLTNNLGLKF